MNKLKDITIFILAFYFMFSFVAIFYKISGENLIVESIIGGIVALLSFGLVKLVDFFDK